MAQREPGLCDQDLPGLFGPTTSLPLTSQRSAAACLVEAVFFDFRLGRVGDAD